MKILLKTILFLFLISACSENSTEPENEKEYWSMPTEEGIMLYYRLFDSVRLDSTIAGEIQYRLDLAKSVVEDTTIKVHKDWRFGGLALKTNDDLYNAFDTTATFRFNYPPLDSLLSLYELKSGYKLFDLIRLKFPEYYNMITISKTFSDINGVIWAEQNTLAIAPICHTDIKLEIDNEIYKFTFLGACPRHFWEVHVVDDSIKIIKEWE